MQYRSEGEEEGLKVRAIAEEGKARVLGRATELSQARRGEGDAEAARIYAQAFGRRPTSTASCGPWRRRGASHARGRPWCCRPIPRSSACSSTATISTAAAAGGESGDHVEEPKK